MSMYKNTKGAKAHSKPFYSDYVRHALRFYTRNLSQPHFNTDVDKANWTACENVVKGYSETDRNILIAVYSGYDTLSDNVYETSKKYHVEQNGIWDMMREVERKIARKRGLL